jgi:hypothetical protein
LTQCRKQCRGEAYLVRYADDFVSCFQYRDDAEAFLTGLKERLGKFNLEVAEEKTTIIEFGRFADENSKPLPRAKVYVSMYDINPHFLRRGR